MEEGWEIVATSGWVRLPPHPGADGNMNLAQWLAAQGRPQMIADLDADPRFESSRLDPAAGPRSLLAEPLVTSDGTILAILVLLDRRSRPFGRRDLDRIRDLLAAGGKALEQAGLLARTDQALARRAAQLAAIQRTARDLNATLDPDKIVGRTLACAMEIAGADAGLVSVSAFRDSDHLALPRRDLGRRPGDGDGEGSRTVPKSIAGPAARPLALPPV